MRVLIITASPRAASQSNTEAFAQAFKAGILRTGSDCIMCRLANKVQWDQALEYWSDAEHILFVVPVYFENAPEIMIRFLETVYSQVSKSQTLQKRKNLSFIVHSGFPERRHRDCAVCYLTRIPEQLGCEFGGIACIGDTLRIGFQEQLWEDVLSKISALGKKYAEHGGTFFFPGADALSGPATVTEAEGKTYCRWVNRFSRHVSQAQRCKEPLGYQPFSPKQNP